ncbi:MAG: peptidoglycan editing factor PgeF [Robiginitomaculum sp.]|nr:peptidoglycan editing factor PgeF [Robiginitomaculum sp.]
MPKTHPDFPVKFAPAFDGLSGISHGFFGRGGGVSKGKYASLNTGHGSGDDKAHVAENRKRVAEAMGTKSAHLLSNHQIHSSEVVVVERPWSASAQPKADGMVTRVPGLALSALSADCSPVLFADMGAGVIGAAHAGWRGALAGVTDATIAAMVGLGAKRKNIVAAIGPCLGAKHFEVGPEFVGEFISENLGNAKFFRKGQIRKGQNVIKSDRSYFDIKAYLLQKLARAGVKNAVALPDCTYASHKDYFSYRHNYHNGITDYGRNISVIMINQGL